MKMHLGSGFALFITNPTLREFPFLRQLALSSFSMVLLIDLTDNAYYQTEMKIGANV